MIDSAAGPATKISKAGKKNRTIATVIFPEIALTFSRRSMPRRSSISFIMSSSGSRTSPP